MTIFWIDHPSGNPAGLFLLAGVFFEPVLTDNFTGTGQPFFVAPKLLQRFRRIMFDAIADGIAKRLQQSRRGQNRNVMRFEAKKPGGFKHIKAARKDLAAQELILSFQDVHAAILPERTDIGCITYTKRFTPAAGGGLKPFNFPIADWFGFDPGLNARILSRLLFQRRELFAVFTL
jgi:hypothetical protein